MGVARGSATIGCRGIKGRKVKVKAVDVVALPAGTAHRLIEASRNFMVVGAYPQDGTYDECTDMRDRPEAKKRIASGGLKKTVSTDRAVYGDAVGLRLRTNIREPECL